MIIGEIRGQQTSQMALAENDDVVQTLAPVPPGVSEQYPKESISRTERRTLDRALEHRQLLTEGQVLKRDRAVSAADQRKERSAAGMSDRAPQSTRESISR